jgi:hypothetical protein
VHAPLFSACKHLRRCERENLGALCCVVVLLGLVSSTCLPEAVKARSIKVAVAQYDNATGQVENLSQPSRNQEKKKD